MFTQEKPPFNLKLKSTQKLLDYAYNNNWFFTIIENGDTEKINVDIYRVDGLSEEGSLKKTGVYDFTKVSPWKIEIGNIDYKDGPQIVMGVNKATHFDKEESKRLFVFNWDGEKLYKKWTGTRLGFYLKDFYIMDLVDIKGDELVVIDKNKEGRERVLVYYWFDFGFKLLAEGQFYDEILELKYADKNLLEIEYIDKGKKKKTNVSINNGYILNID